MSAGPGFDRAVVPGGYAWWYVDALHPAGHFGLAIIGFVGSVFSPYYAWRRQRGQADPLDHCALNVGLYLPGRHYWSMTERGRHRVERSATHLAIGPSAMRWEGGSLHIDIDEWTVPLPRRLRGRIVVHPQMEFEREIALESGGGHRWRPYVPLGQIDVAFTQPQWRWRGSAYCDYNYGNTPLEDAFIGWQWTRAHLPGDRTAVLYDAQPRRGPPTAFSLRIAREGASLTDTLAARTALPRSAWGLTREVGVDAAALPRVARTLESGPFYNRALLEVGIDGQRVPAMHESLSLDRFAAGWVRALLPFRMPRALGAAR